MWERGAVFLVERWNVKILGGRSKAKAAPWSTIDAEVRKHGEQIGLETLVVRAVNDECYMLGGNKDSSVCQLTR